MDMSVEFESIECKSLTEGSVKKMRISQAYSMSKNCVKNSLKLGLIFFKQYFDINFPIMWKFAQ